MESFDLMNEICGKISGVATEIGELDVTISTLQNRGYSETAKLYVDRQLTELDQLHKLVMFLTRLLYPETDDKDSGEYDSNESEEDRNDSVRDDTEPMETNKSLLKSGMNNRQDTEHMKSRSEYNHESIQTLRKTRTNPVSRKAGYSIGKRTK